MFLRTPPLLRHPLQECRKCQFYFCGKSKGCRYLNGLSIDHNSAIPHQYRRHPPYFRRRPQVERLQVHIEQVGLHVFPLQTFALFVKLPGTLPAAQWRLLQLRQPVHITGFHVFVPHQEFRADQTRLSRRLG